MMSHFRTTKISDPIFESNNLRFITVKSKNLKARGDIYVLYQEEIQEQIYPLPFNCMAFMVVFGVSH